MAVSDIAVYENIHNGVSTFLTLKKDDGGTIVSDGPISVPSDEEDGMRVTFDFDERGQYWSSNLRTDLVRAFVLMGTTEQIEVHTGESVKAIFDAAIKGFRWLSEDGSVCEGWNFYANDNTALNLTDSVLIDGIYYGNDDNGHQVIAKTKEVEFGAVYNAPVGELSVGTSREQASGVTGEPDEGTVADIAETTGWLNGQFPESFDRNRSLAENAIATLIDLDSALRDRGTDQATMLRQTLHEGLSDTYRTFRMDFTSQRGSYTEMVNKFIEATDDPDNPSLKSIKTVQEEVASGTSTDHFRVSIGNTVHTIKATAIYPTNKDEGMVKLSVTDATVAVTGTEELGKRQMESLCRRVAGLPIGAIPSYSAEVHKAIEAPATDGADADHSAELVALDFLAELPKTWGKTAQEDVYLARPTESSRHRSFEPVDMDSTARFSALPEITNSALSEQVKSVRTHVKKSQPSSVKSRSSRPRSEVTYDFLFYTEPGSPFEGCVAKRSLTIAAFEALMEQKRDDGAEESSLRVQIINRSFPLKHYEAPGGGRFGDLAMNTMGYLHDVHGISVFVARNIGNQNQERMTNLLEKTGADLRRESVSELLDTDGLAKWSVDNDKPFPFRTQDIEDENLRSAVEDRERRIRAHHLIGSDLLRVSRNIGDDLPEMQFRPYSLDGKSLAEVHGDDEELDTIIEQATKLREMIREWRKGHRQ